MTLRATRLAKAQKGTGAVNVSRLELGRGEADEFSGALEVVLRQVYVPLLITAVNAAGLAFEPVFHQKRRGTGDRIQNTGDKTQD